MPGVACQGCGAPLRRPASIIFHRCGVKDDVGEESNLEKRARAVIRALLDEARRDPAHVARLVKIVAEELGLDPVMAWALATKVKDKLDARQ